MMHDVNGGGGRGGGRGSSGMIEQATRRSVLLSLTLGDRRRRSMKWTFC
jgi:hypothetical protein